jgi:hypothetical protein
MIWENEIYKSLAALESLSITAAGRLLCSRRPGGKLTSNDSCIVAAAETMQTKNFSLVAASKAW